MMKYFLILNLLVYSSAYGMLAGGRLNAFSEGQNAFAGVINPANAVWIKDRFDVGAYWVHQKLTINNRDDKPFFPPGTTDFTYRSKNIITADVAIHKRVPLLICENEIECSFSLALYSTPSITKVRTKNPIPISGSTPLAVSNKTDVLSAVYSVKLNDSQSIGISVDYLYFSHKRNGFQNSDNPLRSVSPGHVTNKGCDHSSGIGFSLGWRWNITKHLNFGTAWTRKSYCGRYQKYRGYEPHHATNFSPQTVGAGFSYRFTTKIAGRLEFLWSNTGNLPGTNNNILPNGKLNTNKRGSNKSPGPGLQDATFINMGIGYMFNEMLSVGIGFSHRIKIPKKNSNFLSHSYTRNTIYDTLSLGANFNYEQHTLFLGTTYGFKNRVSGTIPKVAGGGRFIAEKQNCSLSISWGYHY